MSNEELLKMYEAIKADPGELVRAAARKRLINFARYMQPDLVLEPFHVVYYTLLDMFAHGKIRKMIVQQPPQHGKSEGSSRKLPAFMLGLDPDYKICIGSYAATIARDFNGEPTEIDPREPGAALWESRHSKQKLEAQKALDPVQFQCLYQGNPGSAEGRLYQPFKTWVEKSDYGTYIRSGAYIDVADEGDDLLFAATYDVYKSDNMIFNEKTKRMEPLLFALITDMEMTDENTDVTTVTVPAMINRNGTQKVWVESNNGGAGYEKVIKKKMRAMTDPFYQGGNKESRIITASAMVNQSIIMPFGWETRYKAIYDHVTTFLRNFDANTHDDPEDGLTGIYEKEIADGNIQPYAHANRGVKRRN